MTSDAAAPSTTGHGWRHYLQEKVLVIFFLGFSSGLPFPLVYATMSAWLEDASVERSTISLFAWLGFAYSLKFLWAPLVDTLRLPLLTRVFGQRRSWMLLAQVSIGASLFVLAGMDPSQNIQAFALMAVAVAFSSATQDIVIDAYRIESADDDMQPVLAASYQYGYRVAVLISVAGALYIADYGSWQMAYMAMSGCMLVGILSTLWCREPKARSEKLPYGGATYVEKVGSWFMYAVIKPLIDFYRRFGYYLIVVLLFISLYRISDYVLGILANPFYLAIGFSKSEVATVAKIYGAVVSAIGVGAGAWSALKLGLGRSLVAATTLIAGTNLFFALMAQVGAEIWVLTLTISADNFAQGFSSTVLIAYLTSLTNRDFTATQYALMSSIMTLLPKFIAGFSGYVQEWVGWFGFFIYAGAMGVPAILLAIFVARRHDALVAGNDAATEPDRGRAESGSP